MRHRTDRGTHLLVAGAGVPGVAQPGVHPEQEGDRHQVLRQDIPGQQGGQADAVAVDLPRCKVSEESLKQRDIWMKP